jgi:hypothetical protein
VSELAHGSLEDIAELRSAVGDFAVSSEEAVDRGSRIAEGVLRELDAEVAARRARLAELQQALSACRADERADCTGLEQEVARAAEGLHRAQDAKRSAEGAIARFVSRSVRFRREVGRLATEATTLLAHQADELTRYLGAAATGGSTGEVGEAVPAVGAGPPASAVTAAPPGFPDGYAMVPLSAIDVSDSPVTGPESFDAGYAPADLQWACEALSEVVMPAMAAGLGRDYFRERDATEGRSGVRSFSRTYGGFFGDDYAIKLERRPDGRYEVSNGYHRIWVASRLGRHAVPARIR